MSHKEHAKVVCNLPLDSATSSSVSKWARRAYGLHEKRERNTLRISLLMCCVGSNTLPLFVPLSVMYLRPGAITACLLAQERPARSCLPVGCRMRQEGSDQSGASDDGAHGCRVAGMWIARAPGRSAAAASRTNPDRAGSLFPHPHTAVAPRVSI